MAAYTFISLVVDKAPCIPWESVRALTCQAIVRAQARDGGRLVPQPPRLWLLAVWRGHQHAAGASRPLAAAAARAAQGRCTPSRGRSAWVRTALAACITMLSALLAAAEL